MFDKKLGKRWLLVLVSGKIVLGNVAGIYLGSIAMVAVLNRLSRDRAVY